MTSTTTGGKRDRHAATIRARLSKLQRPTATMTICTDPEAKQALRRAEFAVRAAQASVDENSTDDTRAALTAAQEALKTAQAAFDKVAIVLRFQALERPVWDAMKLRHKPTEEDAEDGALFNAESLAPELIAAASLDGITEDEAREYLNTWGAGEAVTLYNTAFSVQNETRMDVGKG
jgi:hypothetical protein